MSKNKNIHWTNYWQTGALTSLPQDFKSNYDGEIYDFWFEQVKHFDDNSTVVDICTGSGAIAILIKEISKSLNKNTEIIAIDAADIKPDILIKKYPNKKNIITDIKFIGNCSIENIDKVAMSNVDYIVSQYGVEYCNISMVAAKLFSILKPNGQLIFVSHACETDIIKLMETEEKDYINLSQLKILESFRKYHKGDYSPFIFKKKVIKQIKKLKNLYGDQLSDLIFAWMSLMVRVANMPIQAIEQNKHNIINFYDQHRFARLRANDLLTIAKKIQLNPKWFMEFEKYGFKFIEENTIWYQAKYNIGQSYKLEKI